LKCSGIADLQDGWKAVSFHPSGTPFENDKWELFHLAQDFSETDDLATKEPERLEAMIKLWWKRGREAQCAALDDRFGPRFAENAARFHGARNKFTFSRRHGPRADRRGARRPQAAATPSKPMWRSAAEGADGRADRPWRCDLWLQSLHQGRFPGARSQYRRRP